MSDALLTDLYQLTMAYAYFQAGKANQSATFELFFRTCPFQGAYAVFSGLLEVKQYLENFYFSKEQIQYLKSLPVFQHTCPEFWNTLQNIDLKDVDIFAQEEGQVVFSNEPLVQVRGPLLKVQLLESALLNKINFSTLVATYARRMKTIIPDKLLVEFGLRRAQGPNGALMATRAALLGGFDTTSHVEAARQCGVIPLGTMAHSYVQSFSVPSKNAVWTWRGKDISALVTEYLKRENEKPHRGELLAFLKYAQAFAQSSLFVVDTYDSLKSGLPNAVFVFELLRKDGFQPLGVRFDSGDLAYLSCQGRALLKKHGFSKASIFVSSDLDEVVLQSLKLQNASIDGFGIGTKLVTAFSQPALGGVYKLVEVDGKPCMKISDQKEKTVLPAQKALYRFCDQNGNFLLDYLNLSQAPKPKEGKRYQAFHPTDPYKQIEIIPDQIQTLLKPVFQKGEWIHPLSLQKSRKWSLEQMRYLREDVKRFQNPTPYKVSLGVELKKTLDTLYQTLHFSNAL